MTEQAKIEIPESLRAEARRLGWPDDLLDRAVARGMTLSNLQRMAGWGNDGPRMEKKLDWHERMTFGPLRGRPATEDDNEGLRDLFANAPEELGDWEVITERSPNAFAGFRLQENLTLLVIADGPMLVASCGFSVRSVLVDGQRMSVRYGQALRVHRQYRRQGYGDQVRTIGWSVGTSVFSQAQYDLMRSQNYAVVDWWKKYFPDSYEGVPEREGDIPGIPTTVRRFPARAVESDSAIRRGRREDIPRCVELVNRCHEGLDLFRPYTIEFLSNRLDERFWGPRPPWHQPVYCWEDFFVLEEGGSITACAGLYDRGRDLRERWRHRDTDEERTLSDAAVMDWGYAEGAEEAMARLIRSLIGRTHAHGRDDLLAPLQHHPEVVAQLSDFEGVEDTRALRWSVQEPVIRRPYSDLAYW